MLHELSCIGKYLRKQSVESVANFQMPTDKIFKASKHGTFEHLDYVVRPGLQS